jgi:hypothetical protein
MRFLLLIFVYLSLQTGFCQARTVTTFEGFYNGVNLQLECKTSPSTPWQECYCIDSVSLDNQTLKNPLKNGVQVNLTPVENLKIWEPLELKIYYSKSCQLRILNPYNFYPQKLMTVDTLFINYPFLKWETQVEQYKWGEWTKVGDYINISSDTIYQTDISSFSNAGENIFRVAVSNIEYDHFPSEQVTFENHSKKKAKAKFNQKSRLIKFNQKADYVMYNDKKQIVLRGIGSQLSLKSIKKGIYSLYYADKIKKIKIKH